MTKPTIIQDTTLMEYFRERVQLALANNQVEASEMTEFYLVNLLQDFRQAEKIFAQPLAILLLEAMEGTTSQRVRCLKQIGDTALYTAGFFEENLRKRIVGQDYYISMGEGAYRSLGAMFEGEKVFGTLYDELAGKFSQLVSIFSDIAPWNQGHDNIDLLRLYERWLKTGDEKLRALLQRKGITPDGSTSGGDLQ